ncbi:MAG TPA: DoxX family protein [Candidatus Kapabacteria bacterium]|nr:DoxX family protein [Candidatus Kapabacteria bacterium]
MERRRKIAATVLTVIVFLMLIGGGVAKVLRPPTVVEDFTTLGVGEYTIVFGLSEIILCMLFLYPKTLKLSVLLLSAYFGGAMATHVSHSSSPLQPAIPLIFIWIAAYLRESSIFFSPTLQKKYYGKNQNDNE